MLHRRPSKSLSSLQQVSCEGLSCERGMPLASVRLKFKMAFPADSRLEQQSLSVASLDSANAPFSIQAVSSPDQQQDPWEALLSACLLSSVQRYDIKQRTASRPLDELCH